MIHKNQRGFTIVEIMLAIAIAGVITGGITMTIFQVVDGSARASSHMTAVRQVQEAGYWVSQDAQMAQEEPDIVTNLVTGELESITLTWTDRDGDEHTVVYTLLADNRFQRTESITGLPDKTAVIAQHIDPDPAKTSCGSTGGKLIFTVTATVQEQSETRIYEIVPRPGS